MRLLRADILLASVMFQILMIEKIRFFFARYSSLAPTVSPKYFSLQRTHFHSHTSPKASRIFKTQDSSARYVAYINKN